MRTSRLRLLALVGVLVGTATGPAHAQAVVVGTVYDSLVARREMRGATVTIVELNREATTDGGGRFRFDSVPAGRYAVTFFHPTLDSLELSAPILVLEVPPAGTVNARLATPSPRTTYARLCPGEREAGTGVAVGRVRDVDTRRPLGGAVINAEWNEWLIGGGRATSRRIARAVAHAAPGGGYVLCGIPSDALVEVRVASGVQGAGPIPMTAGRGLLVRRDFAISLTDPAARVIVRDSGRIVRADTTAPATGTSTLSGTVRDPSGRLHPDALVGVVGTDASMRTSEVGRFRLTGIPAGTRAVELRALGLSPTTVIVELASGASLDTTFSMEKPVQVLSGVSIVAKGEPADRTGFAARRKEGFGTFLTAADIQRWQPQNVVDVLTLVPAVHRSWSGGAGMAAEIITMRGGAQGQCTPNIFIDGVAFEITDSHSMGDLNALVPPNSIKGVEVYPGPVIPFLYDRTLQTGCGSLVIWTQ
jgi:hypothetical protein